MSPRSDCIATRFSAVTRAGNNDDDLADIGGQDVSLQYVRADCGIDFSLYPSHAVYVYNTEFRKARRLGLGLLRLSLVP